MNEQRHGGHTVSRLTVHLVWVTKYRYPVLRGELKERCRDLIIQICDSEDVIISKGVVSKDRVHMHIEYSPKLSVSEFMRKVKGRTSRMMQREFSDLKKRYWGKHFWSIGYGAWKTRNIIDEMIQKYLEHHRTTSNKDQGNIILE